MSEPKARQHNWRKRASAALFLGCLLLFVASARPCSVPVFRYALERWTPAPYEALVFHRGPLTPSPQLLVRRLDGASNQPPANITVRTVDLDANPAAQLLKLWKEQTSAELPWLVLRYPAGAPVEGIVWSGWLNEECVTRVINSPARSRIAQGLLNGASAVWVLLESGDKSQDNDAARQLQSRLAHLEKTLQLPKLEEEDITNQVVSVAEDKLKVAFSLQRLNRQDPLEQPFIRILLGVEEDLATIKEPIAIPVFGRGRALFGLSGQGINEETIDEACQFLIGPCSCIVKEENPGLDLLLSEDWDRKVRLHATTDPQLPELRGMSSVSNQAARPPAQPVMVSDGHVHSLIAEAEPSNLLSTSILSVVVLAAGVAAAGSLLLWRRKQ